MRVLHFREAFSLLSETFIYDSYCGQLEQGLDAHFATLRRVDEAARPAANVHLLSLPMRIHPSRVMAQVLGRARRLPAWERPFPLYARSLRPLLNELRPHVVHAHFGPAGVIAEEALRGLSIPLVVTFYGHDMSHLTRKARWLDRYRLLFQRVARVAVLSEDMRKVALQHGAPADRTQVVHLSRRLDNFQFEPHTRDIQRWISVGRFVEKKGFSDAIRAVGALHQRGARVRLDIVGEGTLQRELEQLARDLNLQDAVRFLGALPNAEALNAMREADAFLLCSKTATTGDQEGTPTVLIEAQALGLPCVSTLHAGIPEMFPPNARWLLAAEGSVEGIAERMQQLTELPVAQRTLLVQECRAYVEREFALEAQVARYRALYDDAYARPFG